MANKGTQALLKSDVSVIRDTFNGNVSFSVSTTDVEGVGRLNLSLDAVLPPLVDIPYERADFFARKLGYERRSLKYQALTLASLIFMFLQIALSISSAFLVKAGVKGFYRSQVLEKVKKCDIVVSCSDENFKEGASFLPFNAYWIITWWTMLISRTLDVLIAKYFGKPVVLFPNSLGPFRTAIGRFLARLALNRYGLILVRERISYHIAKSLHVSPTKILTYDTPLLFESNINQKLKYGSSPRVGVSPGIYSHVFSEDEIQRHVVSYAEALDEGVEKFGFFFVFLPQYVTGFQYDDLQVSKMIVGKMKNKNHTVIVDVENVDEFKSFIDKMDMVISSKMHPSVFGLSGCVPTVCIAYDHKQTGLFEYLNLGKCVIPLYELSGEKLFSKICYVWNNRKRIKTILEASVPSIRKKIKETIRFALFHMNEVCTDANKRR